MKALAALTNSAAWCRSVFREVELRYLRWAMSEIDPLHDDVPYIVQRINHLEAFYAR